MGFFIQCHSYPVNTDGCAKRINIAHLVSHNQQAILRFHQFPKCMGLDTGLNAGCLFQLLRFSAIILNPASIFHYRLITAPSQSHINGSPGKIIILAVAVSAHTDSDT